MPPRKDPLKPKAAMSSYAFFVQTCREEHRKNYPEESVDFTEFSRKCAAKWKDMDCECRVKFEKMAGKDKERYQKQMAVYTPQGGLPGKGGRKRRAKDPNAPKRSMSAFFHFCTDERPKVRAIYPNYSVGDIAKILGKKWEDTQDKTKFHAMAEKDKQRYDREMAEFKSKKMCVAPMQSQVRGNMVAHHHHPQQQPPQQQLLQQQQVASKEESSSSSSSSSSSDDDEDDE